MRDVVIVSSKRTPIGSFGGVFKDVSAVNLGVTAVTAAIETAGIKPTDVDQVIMGNVLQAGLGQNVARQVAVGAGIPKEVSSYVVNLVCGSGLHAVSLAAQAIMLGDAEIVVAGGTENMSQSPYLLQTNRFGQKMGNTPLLDSMIHDGLTDAFGSYHMGITAENLVKMHGFTREEQDAVATASQNKAEAAQKAGKFADEIAPVSIPQRKGDPLVIDTDEYIKHGVTVEGLAKLRPAFDREGSVTAANASGINDGAAALVLMSREKADSLGLKPLVTIKAFATAGVDPETMGRGPVPSTQKALQKAGLTVADLDLIEANEAFAAQAMTVVKELGLDPAKVNVNGGAIAIGHPIGASGARVLTTLVHEMGKQSARYGLATLCVGGGQGISMIVEKA